MITLRPSSHVYELLILLSYVGEFPYTSIHLLGNKEVWRKLISKLTQEQEYRFPDSNDRVTCRLLNVAGKSKSKSIRLTQKGLSILGKLNPDAARYYNWAYPPQNRTGDAQRVDRRHRVAEAAAFIRSVDIETDPSRLPALQNQTIRLVVPKEPSFYISHELKHIGDDHVNKIGFSRITGMLFCPGCCYPIYNSRDYWMGWNGRGESKVKQYLASIVRLNAGMLPVNSAIMLGRDYTVANITLQNLRKVKRPQDRFDAIYDHLHFIPMDLFGQRLLRILMLPDCKTTLLNLLFEEDCLAGDSAIFAYDAYEDSTYILSFLDSDIFKLNAFFSTIKAQRYKASVICFPEQVAFLRNFLGTGISVSTVTLDMVENAIFSEGSDSNE